MDALKALNAEKEKNASFHISSLTHALPLSKCRILASCLVQEHQFMEGVGTHQ